MRTFRTESRVIGWTRALTTVVLFAYLMIVRTHNISQQFWLFGDQVRDWRIAMGPLTDLPLVGTPSSAGGTMLGPVYYWVLWLVRVLVGPFCEYLPHAGGIGLSLVQSAADAILLLALARRFNSLALALAVVLFAATSPYDMALTATIWNPPLAVALAKITIAVVLFQAEWSLARVCAVVTIAWLALQAHIGAIFTSITAIGWMVVQPVVLKQPRKAVAAARAAVEIVVLLQLPYVFAHWWQPQAGGSFAAADSLAYSLQHPADFRLWESARALGAVMDYLLFVPWAVPVGAGVLLAVAGTVGLWCWRREPQLLVMSIGTLVLAIVGFASWRGKMGEPYWYLPLVVSATAVLALPVAAIRDRRVLSWLTGLILAAVLAAQPARCRAAWQIHRLPEYAALVRGARQVARQQLPVREVLAPFMPAGTNPTFVYELLGGKLSPGSSVVARIDVEGHVQYGSR